MSCSIALSTLVLISFFVNLQTRVTKIMFFVMYMKRNRTSLQKSHHTMFLTSLLGVTSPSEGTAYIEGMDIRDPSSMKEIRKSFGVCPQHDILLDNLTPKEHLEFFARIRVSNLTHTLV